MVTIDGRQVISTADIMRMTGAALPTVRRWYAGRDRNGHPEPVRRDPRLLFNRREWLAWHARFELAKRSQLTTVDRSGNPNELVTTPVAAQILGYSNPNTLSRLISLGYFVDPDATETLPSGRVRRYWRRRTLWRYADSRNTFGTNAGRPAGAGVWPTGPRKAHPYEGDPRLDQVLRRLRAGEQVTSQTLAAETGIEQRTAQRILRTARALADDSQR